VELYEAVRRRMPRISLGTVYRNLDLLAEMGKIQKVDLGGSEARFDANLDPHYHVRCVRCGRVDDVHGLPADLASGELNEPAGYEILGHRLEFVGICPHCKSQAETRDH
jgi:Fur family ferric uptake transcriptional regulator